MLLCRRDVEIGVLALKSLLRFDPAVWAVTITSDGTLTRHQREWVDKHLVGVRWLAPFDAAESPVSTWRDRPRLRALYMSTYQPLRKLIHPVVAARTERVLVLDPDTAFHEAPDRLIRWARDDGPPNLFLHDHQDERFAVPSETVEAFAEIRSRLPGLPWSMPYYFFNSGLLAYERRSCNLDVAEAYLVWLESAPERYTIGKPGLWFGSWTPEQTAYQVMFATMCPAAEPLGDSYRVGNRAGFVFNHFLWLQLVQSSSIKMLATIVESLPRR